MAEMLAMLPTLGESAAAAGSAVPAGMATAGGMASGVGSAGAVGAGAALPEGLSSIMSIAAPMMGPVGNKLLSSLAPQKQNFPAPRPLGASFSMMPPQIPGAGVRPVPAIGSGGGDTSGTQLEMLLKVLRGGR